MNLRSIFEHTDQVLEFPAGATIFVEGTPGDVMYVILDGEVEVWAGNDLVEVLGPGEIVGEMALIDASPRSASIVARSDSRLAPVDERRFLFMVPDTPFFALHVMRVLVGRLRRTTGERISKQTQP
ncbi:MAG TPA: cyclic nucleotide-binding domain-containing protein [Candidatus Binatia bacterium]|nr:cyclic nucleotide-binding domain-containing protein [Candidatus Binatia bacterium]